LSFLIASMSSSTAIRFSSSLISIAQLLVRR
jgi:hypothetical protein